jgi:hypothetical protein
MRPRPYKPRSFILAQLEYQNLQRSLRRRGKYLANSEPLENGKYRVNPTDILTNSTAKLVQSHLGLWETPPIPNH